MKPNPVIGDEAVIEYKILENESPVKIEIYDNIGQLLLTQVDGVKQIGWHEVRLSISSLASGNYYCLFKAGNYEEQVIFCILNLGLPQNQLLPTWIKN